MNIKVKRGKIHFIVRESDYSFSTRCGLVYWRPDVIVVEDGVNCKSCLALLKKDEKVKEVK